MNQEKRKIILDEIEHWRVSRLLPEQYCEFLLNLYSDTPKQPKGNSTISSQKFNGKSWFLSFGIFSLICISCFYFSSFPWPMQIITALIMVSTCYTFSGVYRVRLPLLSLCLAGTASLMMMGFGVWLIALHNLSSRMWVPILIGVCGVLWVLLGHVLSIGLIYYCGLGCWILLYARFGDMYRPDSSWLQLQIQWLPIGVLMICMSWLTHYRQRKLSQVYFAIGLTLWLMPEIDALLLRQVEMQSIMVLGMIKVVVGLGLLFFTRKKWIAWVAT
ncbi:hypothetical protein J2T13_000575 [Paenibacillus sp. DS2015]|uniref:hypothetical protein n=1 Tax=Paenibacillus sp. DS2015 TaxID=3373917 RepID=UPI003D218FC8